MDKFQQDYQDLKRLLCSDQASPVWLIEVSETYQDELSLKLFVDLLYQDHALHGFNIEKLTSLIQQGVCGNTLWIKKNPDKQEMNLEEIEVIHKFASQKPFFSGRRIIIIEKFDTLNRFAVNSLLKLLEEPNSGLYILLLTRNIGEIYATIRSRCSLFCFESPNNLNVDSRLDGLIKLIDARGMDSVYNYASSHFDKDSKKEIFPLLENFLKKLSVLMLEESKTAMADNWIKSQKFLREAKETYLDPIHTFVYIFGLFKGFEN